MIQYNDAKNMYMSPGFKDHFASSDAAFYDLELEDHCAEMEKW